MYIIISRAVKTTNDLISKEVVIELESHIAARPSAFQGSNPNVLFQKQPICFSLLIVVYPNRK